MSGAVAERCRLAKCAVAVSGQPITKPCAAAGIMQHQVWGVKMKPLPGEAELTQAGKLRSRARLPSIAAGCQA